MRGLGFCPSCFSPIFVTLVILSLCMPEQALAQPRITFPMPDVTGLTVAQAEKQVYSAGRSIGSSSARAQEVGRRPDARPAGQIIEQLEKPGTPMRHYDDDVGGKYGEVTFQVVVSTGPGRTQRGDERTEDKKVRDARRNRSRERTDLEEGVSRLIQGIFTEALRPRNTFPMPRVTGLTVAEAEKQVYSAGRSIGTGSARAQEVGRRPDVRPAGQIIEQIEKPGTPMRHYDDDVGGKYGEVTFQVVVSTGPPRPTTFPMPSVIGLTASQAEEKVLLAGSEIQAGSARAVVYARQTDARPAGQIISQQESPGTAMRRYTDDVGGNYGEVTFRVAVSTGPPRPTTFPMPRVIGLTVPQAEEKVLLSGRVIQAGSARAVVYARQTDARPAGQIISQQESPGTPMSRYTDDVGGKYGEVTFRVAVSTGPEPAPDFVGDTVGAAEQYAERNDIIVNVGAGQRNPRIPEGIVIRQDPVAGQPMPQRRVTVYPSTGFPLPDLENIHEQEAGRIAADLSFTLSISRARLVDRIVNRIDSQSPEADTLLPFDGAVSVVVSDGWPTPDFLTLEESEATALAAANQVNLRITEHRPDRETQPGIVIDQDPSPGALIAPGELVGVVLSAPDPTPQLIGLTEDKASDLAVRRDINLDMRREFNMDFALGLVTDQSPDPGAPLPGNGMVSIVVSTGQPIPDFVGKTEEEARGTAAGKDITLVKIAPGEHFELSSGLVIEQRPVAGAVIPVDRLVNISLSLGWPVAPDAVARPFASVEREFLAQYPNAIVEQSQKMLTMESAGTVISQHPKPRFKLGPRQRLSLVSSATKPPWLWPVSGVVLIALTLGVFAGLKSALSSSRPESIRTEDPGGVRLRVTKDHGIQSIQMKDDGDRDREEDGDIVKIRVKVDLGEQSAEPIDDRGKDK